MFQKGDRVIRISKCLMSDVAKASNCKSIPKGYIDNVRHTDVDNYGDPVLCLDGIINPIARNGKEFAYGVEHFEKLVSDSELMEYKVTTSQPEVNPVTPLQPIIEITK